eukprot:1180602-Pleurochrysis_carterae.AAC.1
MARLCSREREREIKYLALPRLRISSKNLKPHNHSGSGPGPTIIWWSCRVDPVEEHGTPQKYHSICQFH